MKRKPEDEVTAGNAKVVRTEIKVPVRPSGQSTQPTASKPASSPAAASTGAYRGTARPSGAAYPAKPAAAKAVPKSNTNPGAPANAPPAAGSSAVQPKKGFASIMAQAKAAQEAAKAAGHSTIKHKPVEKMTKRERAKLREEAAAKKKAGGPVGKLAADDRSRSNTPVDAKNGLAKKPPESTYKGTMKKPMERQQSTYKGTMGKASSAATQAKLAARNKAGGSNKYDGYADWDDLDDAVDEEEDDYESEGSSDDMDAGFDDMEREETAALKAARKEDQEALEEEERHRREKLERKKKLQALSKSAAAKKKF